MPSIEKGQKKVGRPHSEDKAYAAELEVPYRTILRLGGAKKLKALSPEVRGVLLKPAKVIVDNRGLAARGMVGQEPSTKCFRPRMTEWDLNRMYVAHKIWRSKNG